MCNNSLDHLTPNHNALNIYDRSYYLSTFNSNNRYCIYTCIHLRLHWVYCYFHTETLASAGTIRVEDVLHIFTLPCRLSHVWPPAALTKRSLCKQIPRTLKVLSLKFFKWFLDIGIPPLYFLLYFALYNFCNAIQKITICWSVSRCWKKWPLWHVRFWPEVNMLKYLWKHH